MAYKHMDYKYHVISTQNEYPTSGFRIPSRPTHDGTDFIDENDSQITPKGVDIIAFADGKCVEVITGDLVGYTVALHHIVNGKNYLTRYQHMRAGSITVKVGDKVKKGQKLGVMGNTGDCRSTRTDVPKEFLGTHLHFGIKENSTRYNNGDWVDPEPYLYGTKTMGGGSTVQPDKIPDAKPQGIKVGDIVKVNKGAKAYNGVYVAKFIFDTTYKVDQLKGDRAVLDLTGIRTAFNVEDLTKV